MPVVRTREAAGPLCNPKVNRRQFQGCLLSRHGGRAFLRLGDITPPAPSLLLKPPPPSTHKPFSLSSSNFFTLAPSLPTRPNSLPLLAASHPPTFVYHHPQQAFSAMKFIHLTAALVGGVVPTALAVAFPRGKLLSWTSGGPHRTSSKHSCLGTVFAVHFSADGLA